MKIVINGVTGWFCLSEAARRRYAEAKGAAPQRDKDIARDDPDLVRVVEDLGAAANGDGASLSIVEIPDGANWRIENHFGLEWIAETSRTWPR